MGESNLQPKKKTGKVIGLLIAVVAVIAIAVVVTVVLLLPNSASAKALTEKLNLGAKYLAELNYEQAAVEYLAAIEIDPKCEDAYLGLAEVYIADGDLTLAKEILEKGLREAEDTDEILKLLEEVCAELGIPMTDMTGGNDGNKDGSDGQNATGPSGQGASGSSVPAFSASTAVVGNQVVFGSYEQDNNLENGPEAIEWTVFSVQNGQALLLSTYCLDTMAFAPGARQAGWTDSALRSWLNGEFYESAFTEQEKQSLLSQEISVYQNNGYDMVFDKVSLLSGDQIYQRFQNDEQYMSERTNTTLQAKGTPYAVKNQRLIVYSTGNSDWYIRTDAWEVNSIQGLMFSYVNHMGQAMHQWDEIATNYGDNYFMGIRPCILLSVDGNTSSGNGSEGGYTGNANGNYPDNSGGQTNEVTSNSPTLNAESAYVGNIVTFGVYPQDENLTNLPEPLEWRVLDVQNGVAFLISEKILDASDDYVEYDRNKFDLGGNFLWEFSFLRKRLNEDFYGSAFAAAEREKIVPMYVGETIDWEASESALYDNVSILSAEELYRYFPSENERIAYMTEYAYSQGLGTIGDGSSTWWIREDGYRAWVDYFGYHISNTGVVYDFMGVRPCISVVIE